MTVKQLSVIKADIEPSDPDPVDALEQLLALAKTGHLRNLVFCGTKMEGPSRICVSRNIGYADQINLLGDLAIMSHKVAKDFLAD